MTDRQYGLMNILAVWTLFIEHPFYIPTKDCEHRWCWTCDWRKHSVSTSLTLSPCPDIVPHSNLFFTFQLFCSAGWKGGWKLVFLPLQQNEANLPQPAAHWSLPLPPAPLRAKGGQACVAGSCFQHLDKHLVFEWTARRVENCLNCQDGRVVTSSSKCKSCPSGIKGRANTAPCLPQWPGQWDSACSQQAHSCHQTAEWTPGWRAQCCSWRNDPAQTSQSSTNAT